VPRPFPSLRLDLATVRFALVVALVHYLVAAAAFQVATELVPGFAATAAATNEQARGVPIWLAVLVAGLISAPMEEVFWRGAVQPVIAGLAVRRWPALRDRPMLPVVAAAGCYALFHAATLQPALVAAALLGGLVWGWLLVRTGSLPAVMIAHGTWTTLMLLVPPWAGT
jgi:membrane protease YdiL (CAAX protease family)